MQAQDHHTDDMDKLLKYGWVFYIHIALMMVAYFIAHFLTDDTYYIFFRIIAVAWCIPPIFLLWCFYDTKLWRVLALFSCLTLNNVIDEFLFDPTKFGWNEIVFAAFIIVLIFFPKPKRNK